MNQSSSRLIHREVLCLALLCALSSAGVCANGQEASGSAGDLIRSFEVNVMQKVEALEEAVDKGDRTEIRRRLRDLNKALLRHQIALEELHRKMGNAAGSPRMPKSDTATERETLTLSPLGQGRGEGQLLYQPRAKGALVGRIELSGLTPRRKYMLALNDKPPNHSYAKFPQRIPGSAERYYDFREVTTDDKGAVQKEFRLSLSPDKYDVKFFVKDVQDNYQIVLHNDYLRFTVDK